MELNDVQVLQKTYQPTFPPRVNSWEVTKTLLTLAETAALTDAVCSDRALASAGRSLGSALRPGVWAGHRGPVGGGVASRLRMYCCVCRQCPPPSGSCSSPTPVWWKRNSRFICLPGRSVTPARTTRASGGVFRAWSWRGRVSFFLEHEIGRM